MALFSFRSRVIRPLSFPGNLRASSPRGLEQASLGSFGTENGVIFSRRPGLVRLAIATLTGAVCLGAPLAAAAQTATTTTLAASAPSAPAGTVITLTATVTGATAGQVNFCNATASHCIGANRVGSAQLNGGSAVLKLRPGIGAHSYSAVYTGTTTAATSTASAQPVTITGAVATTTTITQAPAPANNGNVTGTVTSTTAPTPTAPTGDVVFRDQSHVVSGIATKVGFAALGTPTSAFGFATGPAPASSIAATGEIIRDFNNDGYPDIAVLSTSGVTVYFSSASGAYTSVTSSVAGATAFVAGDFNHDGNIDIAVTTTNYLGATAGGVALLINSGNSTFAVSNTVYPTGGNSPNGIVAADFDRDGLLDLAVTDSGGGPLTGLVFLKGSGTGTFGLATPVTAYTAMPVALVAADLDEDGAPDIAVANSNAMISVLRNSGTGTFTAQTSPTVSATPTGITASDFNGSGRIDLAVATNSGTAYYLKNTTQAPGTITFTTPSALSTGASNSISSIAAGDVNNDGVSDVVAAAGGSIYVFTGGSNGVSGTSFASAIVGATVLAVADLNGDGTADVAYAEANPAAQGSQLSYYTTSASGSTTVAPAGATGSTDNIASYYNGDTIYAASNSGSSTVPVGTTPTPDSLTLSAAPPSPSTNGTMVSFTATLSPYQNQGYTAGGSVQFYSAAASSTTCSASNTALGSSTTITSTGTASYSTTGLPHGTNYICAIYTDNTTFANASSATLTYVINDTPTVTANLGGTPINLGQSVNLTAGVSGSTAPPPTGSVSFSDGGTAIADSTEPLTTTGTAMTSSTNNPFSYTPTTPGLHGIRATYAPDAAGDYNASTSAKMVLDVLAAPTVSVEPITVNTGEAAPLRAKIQGSYGNPTGGVTFTISTTATTPATVGTVPSSSVTCAPGNPEICTASFPTTGLANGTYTISAAYAGDTTYQPATATSTLTIEQNNFAVPASPATNVGSTSAPQTATLVFQAGGTLNSTLATGIQVTTQGVTGQDFAYVSGGTCTPGTVYYANQTCTVQFTFTPKAAGQRLGGINLYSNDATPVLLGSAYLSGTGSGPQVTFSTPTLTTVATGLNSPYGVATDAFGNVYIADRSNNRVLKSAYLNGTYGTATQIAAVTDPWGVSIDGLGNAYITSNSTGIVTRLTPTGSGTYSQANVITGISAYSSAVDAGGNLYIAGFSTTDVYIATPSGPNTYTTTSIASGAQYAGIAVDASGNIYVVRAGNNDVVKYAAGTYAQSTIASGFTRVRGVAVDVNGNVYVTDAGTSVLYKETHVSGNTYTQSTVPTSGLNAPRLLGIDGNGDLYLADTNNNRAVKLSFSTAPVFNFGSVALGGSAGPQATTVFNYGNAPLTPFTYSEGDAADFPDTGTCQNTAPTAPNASCTISVTFTPQTIGSKIGNVQLNDNAFNMSGAYQKLHFVGTATQGTATVTITNPKPTYYVTQGGTASLSATLTVSSTTPPSTGIHFNINGTNPTTNCSGTGATMSPMNCTAQFSTAGLAAGSYTETAKFPGDANYTTASDTSTVVVVAANNNSVPATPVGATSTTTGMATIVFNSTVTPSTISVTTLGATGKDYVVASGGSCTTGTQYTAGQSCTVNYTFTPTLVGPRPGAVALYDTNNVLVGIQYLNSVGTGAVADYQVPAATLTLPYTGITTPQDAVLDASSTAYITSSGSTSGIRKVTSTGTTTAITVPSGAGAFYGVAVDGAGRVFATATGGLYVVPAFPAGTTTAVAYAPAGSLTLSSPRGIAIDASGNIFVADSGNARIVEYPANGSASVSYATGITGYGLAVDASDNLYVATTAATTGGPAANTIVKIPAGGGTPTAVPTSTTFSAPRGVGVDLSGNVFVSDNGAPSAYEIPNGSTTSTAAIVTGPARSANMLHLTPTGKLYVAEGANNDIALLDRTSASLATFGATMVGATSGPEAATLENNGLVTTLTPTNFVVTPATGTSSSDFTVSTASSSCANGAAPGAVCKFRVTFTPTSEGFKSATVTFSGATNATSLLVTGNAIQTAPTVVVSNPANVEAGSTITLTASVTGSGVAPMGSVGFQIDGGAATTAAVNGTAPNTCTTSGNVETCSVTVSTVGLSQGGHTILATFNGDANYVTATGNGSFNITSASFAIATSTPVGSGSSLQTAQLTFTSAGAVSSINILNQGSTTGDFRAPASGTTSANACTVNTTTSYPAGTTCNVDFKFNPATPGEKYGAITLTDGNGNTLATAYISGLATGPETAFTPGVETPLIIGGPASANNMQGLAMDGSGNIFFTTPYATSAANRHVYESTRQSNGTYSTPVPLNTVVAGTTSQIPSPAGLALDGAGNLYVSQSGGIFYKLTLVNGSYSQPVKYGTTGTQAYFNDLAVDAAGNVYVANGTSATLGSLFKYTFTGTGYNVSTVASGRPYFGVSVDGTGNLYATVIEPTSPFTGNVYKETLSQGSYTESLIASTGDQNWYPSAPNAAGELYVPTPDTLGGAIKLTPPASGTTYAQTPVATDLDPTDAVLDASGNVFFVDFDSNNGDYDISKLDVSDPPSLNFASTAVGATNPAAQTVTLENIGNTALTQYGTGLTAGSPDFTYSGSSTCLTNPGASGQSIAVAGTCSAIVAFTPKTNGPLTEALRFASNDLNNTSTSQKVVLTGNGVGASTTVAANTSAPQGGTATFSATVTGASTGAAPGGGTVTFSGSVNGTTISASGTCTTVSGTDTCSATATTSIAGIAPGGPYSLTVTYAGDTYTAGSSGNFTLTVVPASATATQTAVGGANDSTVTFAFTTAITLGSTPYAIYSHGATGTASDFRTTSSTPSTCTAGTTYQAGQSCTVAYRFKPQAPGARLGGVTLYNNASPSAPIESVYISGVATGALASYTSNQLPSAVASTYGFSGPNGVAVDAGGNVYVADNTQVLMIPADPTTHRATANSAPTSIGTGLPNGFSALSVAVDGLGNVFVADSGTSNVYELPATNGIASSTSAARVVTNLSGLQAVAVDSDGNLYYAAPGGGVYEIPASALNSANPSSAAVACFANGNSNQINALALDATNNLYANDYSGTIFKVAGCGGTSSQLAVNLDHPNGLTVDAAGDVYFVDATNALREIPAGTNASNTPNTLVTGLAGALRPGIDGAGRVYVALNGSTKGVQVVDFSSPAAVSFPTTIVGSSANSTFPIQNAGNSTTLAVSGITTTSTATPNPYTASTTGCSSEAAGASTCSATVTFTPTAANATTANNPNSGTVSIADNSAALSAAQPQTGTLTGLATVNSTVTASSPTATYGDATTTVTVTVTTPANGPAPTGTVSVSSGTNTATGANNGLPGPATVSGVTCTAGTGNTCTASVPLTTTGVAGGTYTLTTTFTSTATNVNGGTATSTLTVTTATPTVSGSANPTTAVQGNPVTLQATVTGVTNGVKPTGTVTFSGKVNGGTRFTLVAGVTCSTTSTSAGTCVATTSYDTTSATPGSYVVVATYNADGNYAAANSPSFNFTVTVPPGTLTDTTVSGLYGTANSGASSVATLTVTGNYSGVSTPPTTATFTLMNASNQLVTLPNSTCAPANTTTAGQYTCSVETGTLTANAQYTVNVTVSDSAHNYASSTATNTFTEAPAQLVTDPGFENGGAGYVFQNNAAVCPNGINSSSCASSMGSPYAGTAFGLLTQSNDSINTALNIPTAATATLTLYVKSTGGEAGDNFTITIRDSSNSAHLLSTVVDSSVASGYVMLTFDLSSFQGQAVGLYLYQAGGNTAGTPSYFLLDNVSVLASHNY